MRPSVPYSVVIPWRATPSREPLKNFVIQWYTRQLGVRPILVDSDYESFNISAARNRGVAEAEHSVVVIADADTIPDTQPLLDAIGALATDTHAHLPFSVARYLDARNTRNVLRGVRPSSQPGYDAHEHSGSIMVVTKDIWAQHGGQDERFIGWGYEDWAWKIAHDTLIGPVVKHDGRVICLHHEPAPKGREILSVGEDLYARYQAASGNLEAMNQLVFTERGLDIP